MNGLYLYSSQTKFQMVFRNHLVHLSVCAIVSGPYLSYEETLDVPTLHKDWLCHFKEKCIIPF